MGLSWALLTVGPPGENPGGTFAKELGKVGQFFELAYHGFAGKVEGGSALSGEVGGGVEASVALVLFDPLSRSLSEVSVDMGSTVERGAIN